MLIFISKNCHFLTIANNVDPDQTQQNVGPDLQSKLFDIRTQKTDSVACNESSSEYNEVYTNFTNCPITFGGHCILTISKLFRYSAPVLRRPEVRGVVSLKTTIF